MNRGTGSRPPGTASRPPGTATRLTTGMVPGAKGGMVPAGVSLQTPLQVQDRPMTQQGLGGFKTGMKGHVRVVQDTTYFLGLLRSKMSELSTETIRLQKEIDAASEEQANFLSYEKRAESLAAEIKNLQSELGDYNTLVDKLNTDQDISDVQMDYEELRLKNEKESKILDGLFEQRKDKEALIKSLELELNQEKMMAENLVSGMKPEIKQKYLQMKDMNEHLLKQLEAGQQELDNLVSKKINLEEELSVSQVKQEAVRLYEQLHEMETKRDSILEEMQGRGTPAEERERLLRQVKEDNQEIASMDRQTNEIREKISMLQEEMRQLEMDIEENSGERNQKYKELKKREESMNATMGEFLDTFDSTKSQEMERMSQLETNIVSILELMSRNMARAGHLPSKQELSQMQEDLEFKSNEMKKSKQTAMGLAEENDKLQSDLQKVEQLESKITSEMDLLKQKTTQMEEDLVTYSDLDKLKRDGEARKKKLQEDKVSLAKRRDAAKKLMQEQSTQYEALKAQLHENETYAQLGNLEKKWQHHEQNNFVMKEFIAMKTMECDYRPLVKKVEGVIGQYNQLLQTQLVKK